MLRRILLICISFFIPTISIAAANKPFFTCPLYNTLKHEAQSDLEAKSLENIVFMLPLENFSPEIQIQNFIPLKKPAFSPQTALEKYYFEERKYLGLLDQYELEATLGYKKPSIFVGLQKKINAEIERSTKLLKNVPTDELIKNIETQSIAPENNIIITKALKKKLILRCKKLFQSGNDEALNKILTTIDQNYLQESSNFQIPLPKYTKNPYKDEIWELEFLDAKRRYEATTILTYNKIPIFPHITNYSFNKNRQAMLLGTEHGEVIFCNLITKKTLSLKLPNNNRPITCVFFDASSKIGFALYQDGVLAAWNLTTQKNTFQRLICPPGYTAIPNKLHNKLLLISRKQIFIDQSDGSLLLIGDNTFTTPIIRLTFAQSILQKISTNTDRPINHNSPLYKQYKEIQHGF